MAKKDSDYQADETVTVSQPIDEATAPKSNETLTELQPVNDDNKLVDEQTSPLPSSQPLYRQNLRQAMGGRRGTY